MRWQNFNLDNIILSLISLFDGQDYQTIFNEILILHFAKQDDHQNDDGTDPDELNDDDAHFDDGQDGARAMED